MKKLMYAYCDRQSVELNSVAFMFVGRRLRGEQTPDEKDAAGKWIEALKGAAGLAGLELKNTLDATMDEISLLQYYVRNRFPEKPPDENTTAGIAI
nr:small ubiquitin-related modifier 1-like [Tanacetum cinerariifolium]